MKSGEKCQEVRAHLAGRCCPAPACCHTGCKPADAVAFDMFLKKAIKQNFHERSNLKVLHGSSRTHLEVRESLGCQFVVFGRGLVCRRDLVNS